MTFNILSFPNILSHIQQISPKMYRKLNKEIMIHCPFCDDALRPKALNHGHLYLSIESPVFNCFRCNTSGTLINLLLQTGFDDQETINILSQFIKINFTKDYYKAAKDLKDLPAKYNQLKKKIVELNLNFRKSNPELFQRYRSFLNQRIGEVDYLEFLLYPGLYRNNLVMFFNNFIGENVLVRFIENNKIRYMINKNTSRIYYFQNINKLFYKDKYQSITFCEGPFDIINLYLYNDYFKNNLFISLNGKNYINTIENILITNMLIGDYQINLVFDSDFLNKSKYIMKSVSRLVLSYNSHILVNGFKPINNIKDTGEFPAIERIDL